MLSQKLISSVLGLSLQDMKPGDKMEAKLREAPKC